jgi:hypothetical protein
MFPLTSALLIRCGGKKYLPFNRELRSHDDKERNFSTGGGFIGPYLQKIRPVFE